MKEKVFQSETDDDQKNLSIALLSGSFEIEDSWRKVGNEYKLGWKEMYDEDKVGWKWRSRMQDYYVEVEGTLFEGEEFSGRFKSSLNFTGYYLLKRSKQRIF